MRTFKSLGILFLVILLGCSARAEVKPGDAAPDFALKDTAGKQHKLSDYKGKIVVLEWTNPECPFVQRHYGATATMTRLASRNSDVVWLAIDSTSSRTPADDAEWAKQQAIGYPILSDAEGTVGKAYGAKATPHMFIISKDGKVVYAGAIDDDPQGSKTDKINYVAKALAELQANKLVSTASTKAYGCSVKYK